ncbi:hypothetical protein [Streptococcus phage vB_SbRt-pBovineS21]|nr:hypothetical protein [Streptococcus phage vB_SbRt-pBovineS21]
MTTSSSTYRVSINYKSKVILLSKPLKECKYFHNYANYIDTTYKLNNQVVNVHFDTKNHRSNHYTPNYKTAKLLFEKLKNTKKDYFFYNSLDN